MHDPDILPTSSPPHIYHLAFRARWFFLDRIIIHPHSAVRYFLVAKTILLFLFLELAHVVSLLIALYLEVAHDAERAGLNQLLFGFIIQFKLRQADTEAINLNCAAVIFIFFQPSISSLPLAALINAAPIDRTRTVVNVAFFRGRCRDRRYVRWRLLISRVHADCRL